MIVVKNWTETELLKLISAGQEENLQLDFKRTVVLDDKGKTELSKDVSAFANTIGGQIIIGMDEDPSSSHKAISLVPLDPKAVSKETLEQVINSRIQPRILGIRIWSVDLLKVAPGQVAYILEIPESSTAHQAYDGRYYRRFNFLSERMADYEIRQAMNRSSMPAYAAWFTAWQTTQMGPNAVVRFRATVVNVSEITPATMSAVLYLPAKHFGLGGESWNFTGIEGQQYKRVQGAIGSAWSPGRPSQISFEEGRVEFDLKSPPATEVRVHLKLFDEHGLGLYEEYALSLPALTHTVVRTESSRKSAAVVP